VLAAAALPTHTLIAWWRDWIARHSHLLARGKRIDNGGGGQGAAVTPTMLAWLTVDSSLPEGVDPDRLIPLLPTPHLRARWGLTPPTTALVRTLTGHTGMVNAVAWSPDGTRLASASHDGTICVFDLDCPDHLTYLQVEPLNCLQWVSAGIAIGGPQGVGVLDLAYT
jgi:WD domain, G-beta repeat